MHATTGDHHSNIFTTTRVRLCADADGSALVVGHARAVGDGVSHPGAGTKRNLTHLVAVAGEALWTPDSARTRGQTYPLVGVAQLGAHAVTIAVEVFVAGCTDHVRDKVRARASTQIADSSCRVATTHVDALHAGSRGVTRGVRLGVAHHEVARIGRHIRPWTRVRPVAGGHADPIDAGLRNRALAIHLARIETT